MEKIPKKEVKTMQFFFRVVLFVFFSAASLCCAITPEGFREYEVKKGDTFSKIAPREHWDIIKQINRIDESHLIIGKKIFLPTDWELAKKFAPVPKYLAQDDKWEKALFVFLDSQYFGAYENGQLVFWGPISSGSKEHTTPRGVFKVLWKTPFYRSKKYNADMPFAVNISDGGIFLHQQALPGRPASHGCVRLLESDAKKIFYWVKKNDPVILAKQPRIFGAVFLCAFLAKKIKNTP
ncbi:MAG: L,D-transpeptidase [Candidatus Moranbacteria bacterium CG06_land_8_20_14_3_00_40_12]|nr:MAG: L,D-transpeptidase [Candidatus Moranbacteria bacterium CG23_combo_of_CG06-09_8_20_14_all_40_16]PIU80969.1 MAG: L,D-transpeptidase [Candidatus Moranbacteria bacterium CG06_land_8_20_14_3_00_40_12]